MARTRKYVVLCRRNNGYEASLERWKLYPAIPDATAAKHAQIRVIDESGEDYLYPDSFFETLPIRAPVQKAILAASKGSKAREAAALRPATGRRSRRVSMRPQAKSA